MPARLLDEIALERSAVVANCSMNRERGAVGVNSYAKELRLDPIAFLAERLAARGTASWLDLCCGRGQALIDAAERFVAQREGGVALHGVDLAGMFAAVPESAGFLRLEAHSLQSWRADREYDLITCVHGLHHVGDKLGLIERAAGWLTESGLFVASLDLANLRQADGKPLRTRIAMRFRDSRLRYDGRRHLLSIVGRRTISLGFRFVGADDTAGPNYTGQAAVDSYYEPADEEASA